MKLLHTKNLGGGGGVSWARNTLNVQVLSKTSFLQIRIVPLRSAGTVIKSLTHLCSLWNGHQAILSQEKYHVSQKQCIVAVLWVSWVLRSFARRSQLNSMRLLSSVSRWYVLLVHEATYCMRGKEKKQSRKKCSQNMGFHLCDFFSIYEVLRQAPCSPRAASPPGFPLLESQTMNAYVVSSLSGVPCICCRTCTLLGINSGPWYEPGPAILWNPTDASPARAISCTLTRPAVRLGVSFQSSFV